MLKRVSKLCNHIETIQEELSVIQEELADSGVSAKTPKRKGLTAEQIAQIDRNFKHK